jgi:hypothetical protein
MRSVKHILGFVGVFFVLLVAGKISKVHLWQNWVDSLPDTEVRNSQRLEVSEAQLAHTAILRVSRLQTVPRLLVTALAAASSVLSFDIAAPAQVRIQFPSLPRLVARRDFLLSAPPMAP